MERHKTGMNLKILTSENEFLKERINEMIKEK
jgi:hypothetical protein